MELFAFFVYFSLVLSLGIWSYFKVKNALDFNLGSRSLGYVLTAMAAHASDMSSWLFMGYPAMIFLGGLCNIWIGVGLLVFMWLNWTFVAPKIRTLTEELDCSTISLFFEKKIGDQTGVIRLTTALLSFLFYSVYISSGLVGLGILGESLFHIDYFWAITLGVLFVLFYLSLGGYVALAWLDLFQGIFLLFVILAIPFYLFFYLGGVDHVWHLLSLQRHSLQLFPPGSFWEGGWETVSMVLGWGLGYFGQPHILTKFMGISQVSDMKKSRFIGMNWMILSLLGATAVGLLGIVLFSEGLKDPETVFIEMVKVSLHPFLVGLILCAVIAATINVMSSQLLVMASTLTEDVFLKLYSKKLSGEQKLTLSRFSVGLVALVAYLGAYLKLSSVFLLVKYAWAGLGASFGPLILVLLYKKRVSTKAALAGIIVGGVTSALWPLLSSYFLVSLDPMVPAYLFSFLSIWGLSERDFFLIKDPKICLDHE